ncbi:MAG: hypothetical protein EOM59_19780, partial [Clostridia bacterium]|nr:hypothetical protein [Clostridia bacterium]
MALEALKQYAIDTHRANEAKPPIFEPTDELLTDKQGNTYTNTENPTEGLKTPSMGIQIEADQKRAQIEQAAAVLSEYQRNIKASGQLLSDIQRGALQGESVYTLFLKAAEAISCMTGNAQFYKQLEADIKTIYGE